MIRLVVGAARYLLVCVAMTNCATEVDTTEDELLAVPISISTLPIVERNRNRKPVTAVVAPAPDSSNIQPWVIRGIRLWEDDGSPCNEPLEVDRCTVAQFIGQDPYCIQVDRDKRSVQAKTFKHYQSKETGEFEISGIGPSVVFAGVQAQVGLPRSLNGEAERAALLSLHGGEQRHLILYCQSYAEFRVEVADEAGRLANDWHVDIWTNWRHLGGVNTPVTFQKTPAGSPMWVQVSKPGITGILKQVVLERSKANRLTIIPRQGANTTLTGRVTSQTTGEPASPVRINARLLGEPNMVVVGTLTDEEGRYFLELIPGNWRIQAFQLIGPGWGEPDLPFKVLSPGVWTLNIQLPRTTD